MSKNVCQCGENLNLGVKKTANFGVAKKIGFVETKNSTGATNFLDLTATWNTAFWNAELARADFAQRLLLTPEIEDYAPTISDPQTVTRSSGKVVKTQDGVTSYVFYIDGADGTQYESLKALECKDVSFYIIDDCGSVAGQECVNDELAPKRIGLGTMDVQLIPGLDTDIQRVKVSFSLALSQSPAWDIVETADQDNTLLDLSSICDAGLVGTTSVNTQTQTVGNLAAFSSFAKKNIAAEGLDAVPFTNWTITDSAGGVSNPTTVTETAGTPGEYTWDYASIATGVATFYYLDNNFEVTFTTTIV